MNVNRSDEIIMRGFTSDDMKPCPFCLSSKLVVARFCGAKWTQCVRCENCGAEGPQVYEGEFMSIDRAEKSAMEEWNAR